MAREPATRPRYDDLPDMVTPDEGAAFLGLGRNTMYDLLKSGAIRSVRYGRLLRIPKAALLDPSVSVEPKTTKTTAHGKPLSAVAMPDGRRR